jgi:ubiquinone/menaquinone biosynthesis C-methylase UbiE
METDPKRMDKLAKVAFAQAYPLIARQITDKYGITQGTCIDIGSGPASLAIALAEITELKIYALDISPEMQRIADTNIAEKKLESRILTMVADVHNIPFNDNSIDLVVSRGSIFFWEDRPAAFEEIYRILRPGGVAYCGGGFGSEEMKENVASIINTSSEITEDEREAWNRQVKKNLRKVTVKQFQDELSKAQVPGKVAMENAGLWVRIFK